MVNVASHTNVEPASLTNYKLCVSDRFRYRFIYNNMISKKFDIKHTKYLFNLDHMISAAYNIYNLYPEVYSKCSFIYEDDRNPQAQYTNWGGKPNNYFAVQYSNNLYSIEEFHDILLNLLPFMD